MRDAVKRKLLSEYNLTWINAFEIAADIELAEGQITSTGSEIPHINKTSKEQRAATMWKLRVVIEKTTVKGSTRSGYKEVKLYLQNCPARA